MSIRRTCRALLAAACWAFAWPTPAALARGALTLSRDVCLLTLGANYMFFSGYQSAKPRKRFCEDVPATGDTIFAMDFAQDEMREMKVDFRILRDVGEVEEREVPRGRHRRLSAAENLSGWEHQPTAQFR